MVSEGDDGNTLLHNGGHSASSPKIPRRSRDGQWGGDVEGEKGDVECNDVK